MAKRYKIKRSKNAGLMVQKSAPHPFAVILVIAVAAGLVFLGVSLYGPVYDFIMGLGHPSEEVSEPGDISEPESSVPEVSQPDPEPVLPETIHGLRAVYMPPDIALDQNAAGKFLDGLPRDKGVNSVMIDIKTSQGLILFSTVNEKAAQWGASADETFDLKALTDMASEKGLYIVARMNAFSDPVAARGDRVANAIKYQNSEMLWLDNYADMGGKPWLSPYSPEARAYLVDIAKEAAGYGVAMIVMDSVRFPDDMTSSATFGGAEQETTRAEALKSFMDELENTLTPLGTRVALYVPSTAVSHLQRDARYGGNPLALASDIMLGVLPEQLETGYLAEGAFVTKPALDPAATVRETLSYVKQQPLGGEVNLIPLMGAENSGGFSMTEDKVNAQIEAAESEECGEYVLYSSSGKYPWLNPIRD